MAEDISIKKLSLLFLLISFNACNEKDRGVTSPDIGRLSWLEGSWTRIGMPQGKSGFEIWDTSSPFEYSGTGISLRGQDTTFVEKLRIVAKEDGVFYVADVPENQEPVYFKFTTLTDSTFVCENPDHDFPKKISYTLKENRLTALLSGGGREVEFLFERNWPGK